MRGARQALRNTELVHRPTLSAVAIRDWWAGIPEERYWVEVTDRDDLGSDLIAPTTGHTGKATPTYSLVSHVEVGDLVLHWWKQLGQEPAFIGLSQAVAPVQDAAITWRAHGTYGRESDQGVEDRPAWRVPLGDYTPLERPVTLTDVREKEDEIRLIREGLLRQHGTPIYFPFALSERRPLRTAQGYLFKLPGALVELLEIREAIDRPAPVAAAELAPRRSGRRGRDGSGRQDDALLRKAIERHAVDWTLAHLEGLGYLVEDVGDTNPFDVLAVGPQDDELHVEVKGSSGEASTVELTSGEVSETERELSVLVVVDQIAWTREPDGSLKTEGGRPRIWWPWAPEHHRLTPTRYRYLLPPER